ncbi:hypothetical protein RO3G_04612 [Rhizopus delemar RA 99-880]|uniref:Uncharacterized protein n=1 Tax=Rhizopus delemar (strain RA 99-880 / ATCC MYA-4621 / FGSC 9543 / NRRL 43880) TaxID=246409 RepID=I1BUM7_RHIO9|nr:hypothetical protein RO3G_04612 [Rhizopus delemar RA 99-880]|eukprot:EIE79907.1 hypothetical protein RO3G_04612 [Rhizopus delemar RA 99-880]
MNTENTALSAQSPAATRLPRSPNWSKGDDIKLCEAWTSTSSDRILRSDQKYETL